MTKDTRTLMVFGDGKKHNGTDAWFWGDLTGRGPADEPNIFPLVLQMGVWSGELTLEQARYLRDLRGEEWWSNIDFRVIRQHLAEQEGKPAPVESAPRAKRAKQIRPTLPARQADELIASLRQATAALLEAEKRYNPDQPRHPAGEATKEIPMDQTDDLPASEVDKLRGTFGLPAEAAPAADAPAEAEKALSWVDRLRATFGLPPLGSAEKRYDPDQPRHPKGDPRGGQWTSDVHSPDRRGRFSKVEARGLMSMVLGAEQGFSYQPFDDYSPTDGYMVSIYEERGETMKPSEVSETRFGRYVNRNNDLLVEDNHFFGGWLDTEEDMVALDVSIRAETAEEANRLGCKNNQKAFWDVKRKLEVKVEC